MKTTHAASPRSIDREHWAIPNTTHAQQRLVVFMRDHAPAAKRGLWQAVAIAMILVGDDETGCLRRPLAKVAETSGMSRPTVERAIRGLVELEVLRRESNAPGDAPTYRWLRPVAERIFRASVDSRGLDVSTHLRTPIWLRGGIPAVASDSAEPESSVRLRELEPVAPAPAAALWSQIEAHDIRAMWLEVFVSWRTQTLKIHAQPQEPSRATWSALGNYAALFAPAEQRRALELTCQLWPEVTNEKTKLAGYRLAWLEHDLEALEPRVRRALAVAAQREQRPAERSTATSSPVTPDERRQLARAFLGALGGGRAA